MRGEGEPEVHNDVCGHHNDVMSAREIALCTICLPAAQAVCTRELIEIQSLAYATVVKSLPPVGQLYFDSVLSI